MNRGFIQIPILIAIIAVGLLGGGAFVAYEVSKPAKESIQTATTVAEVQATTTVDVSTTQPKTEDDKDSVIDTLKKQVADLTQKVSAPKTETQTNVSAPKTTTVTLPSGAIVEMDANGNIIRTVQEAPQSSNTSSEATTKDTETLSVSLTKIVVTPKNSTFSVYISWTTNIPATGKVFLQKLPVNANPPNTQVTNSAAGLSTQGFVNIGNLTSNNYSGYAYTIEVIAGSQVQKLTGTFPAANTQTGTINAYPSEN